ncbi:hypothetical protein ENSA5_52900 [Enhygromyxa salina]|uniref:DUF58 domain-containing protein n=1 Tax=Enhygromyxa salina TaxID=215803 RepID=A0A2S9XG29_9BACT|nr:DUF58 domain-containing protein [Enhygromyxa salina]PRP91710.1 hypothetical protein ENSA5_52900 [Enhygromyxa salina]
MLIPARSLVWLALVPVILACIVPFDESMLWPMLMVDLALVVLAAGDALASVRKLLTVSRRTPEVFSIGRPNSVTVELRSRARRRLAVELTCELFERAEADDLPLKFELRGGARTVERFRVVPRRRGAFNLGDIVVRYPSPLGLWKRQVRFPAHHPVRVYPDVQSVRTWELLARQDRQHSLMRTTRRLGGESEFEQLRDYTRDDEFRSIDWKATARRGKLTARQYQLESNQNLMFVLDGGRLMTGETAGLSLFDHALNATLMLAHVASRGGDRVGLLSYAQSVQAFVSPGAGRRAVQKLIQASYALHPELVEPDPEGAFEVLNLRVRQRNLVVLFTQVIDERAADELVRVTRGLASRHLPLIVLFRDVDVDALLEGKSSAGELPASPARVAELDLYIRGAAAELISWRDQLIRKLGNHGALVLDVDPSELTPALINRYLEIKARHLL